MAQRSRYTVYVFDRNDKYIGTVKDAPLSKGHSFDVYFDDKFIYGEYFKPKLRVSQKLNRTRRLISSIEKERKLQLLKRTSPKDFRREFYNLPFNFDIMLFGSNGRRIKSTQLSKAKYFKILTRRESGAKWETIGDWEFGRVSLSVNEKRKIIQDLVEEKEAKPIVILEPPKQEDVKEEGFDYTLWRKEGLNVYTRADGTNARSALRVIDFDESIETRMINKSLIDAIADPLEKLIKKEFKKEYNLTGTFTVMGIETKQTRFRVKLVYTDPVSGEQRHKWISTSRRFLTNVKEFEDYMLPEFTARMGQMLNQYVNAFKTTMSIDQVIIETEIPA
jgi:hypothetical protein